MSRPAHPQWSLPPTQPAESRSRACREIDKTDEEIKNVFMMKVKGIPGGTGAPSLTSIQSLHSGGDYDKQGWQQCRSTSYRLGYRAGMIVFFPTSTQLSRGVDNPDGTAACEARPAQAHERDSAGTSECCNHTAM